MITTNVGIGDYFKLQRKFEEKFFSTTDPNTSLPIRETHQKDYPGKHINVNLEYLNDLLTLNLSKQLKEKYKFRLNIDTPVPFYLYLTELGVDGNFRELFISSFDSERCTIDLVPRNDKLHMPLNVAYMKYCMYYDDFWGQYVDTIIKLINKNN